MIDMANVQNGTKDKSNNELCIVDISNSNSSLNVSYYMCDRDKYKSEFNQWSKKTAQSTLEMCRVVYEAKKGLENQDFLKFCNEIGRKGEDATVRKYLKIGEKFDKFYQYAELLPNSWTSIYEITQLPSDTFEALVATENSLANMTGDQIKELMGKKTEDKTKTSAAIPAQFTTAAPTTSAQPSAPQTAQKSKEVSEDSNARSSKTEESATAIANSDAKQAVSSESSTQSISVATETTSDVSSSGADREFAQQATSSMLERVTATTSAHVEIDTDEKFEPYEIAIRFNSKPSDIAAAELVESLLTIKSKYRLDFEFVQQKDFAM